MSRSCRFALLLVLLTALPCRAGLIGTGSEVRLGQDAARQLEQKYGTVNDPRELDRLAVVGRRLVALCGRSDLKQWHFRILDTKEVNALAVPGGWVYVTRGLVGLSLPERELAFVLGHEITHIAQRHGVKQLERSLGMELLLGVVTKGERARLAGQVTSMLLTTGYSRQDEYRADAGGLSLLSRAGHPSRAAIDFLHRLQEIHRESPNALERLFATHPPTQDRIARLDQQIRKAEGHLAPSLARP